MVEETVKNKVVDEYIRYLSENTHGEQAYQYSYTLRKFMNNTFFKDSISGSVDSLYNEKSFLIYDVTEQQYCNEVKTRCDNMAAYRTNVLLKEITGKKVLEGVYK
ncbi:MAG: hypothetical protein K2M78_05445 [Lachnospiraceae bacterium]|nr:hypothetical protein [Lachnospiraceae bacterium]